MVTEHCYNCSWYFAMSTMSKECSFPDFCVPIINGVPFWDTIGLSFIVWNIFMHCPVAINKTSCLFALEHIVCFGSAVRPFHQHYAMSDNCSITLNFQIFPVCDFSVMCLSKFPILDGITLSWCDVICAPTIQVSFNFVTCLVAGKVDRFTASYPQFWQVCDI